MSHNEYCVLCFSFPRNLDPGPYRPALVAAPLSVFQINSYYLVRLDSLYFIETRPNLFWRANANAQYTMFQAGDGPLCCDISRHMWPRKKAFFFLSLWTVWLGSVGFCASTVPSSGSLLCQRAELHMEMRNFNQAVQDANSVCRLKPLWTKVSLPAVADVVGTNS